MKLKLKVKGTHCKSCKMLIEDELEELGAQNIKIEVDETKQEATVECEIDKEKSEIVKAIESLGEYKVEK